MTAYDGYLQSFGLPWFNSTKKWANGVRSLNGQVPPIGGGGAGPSPVVINYRLAAVDTGVGRRSWDSTAINFSQAPSPVGSWNVNTLTILYSWQ